MNPSFVPTALAPDFVFFPALKRRAKFMPSYGRHFHCAAVRSCGLFTGLLTKDPITRPAAASANDPSPA